MNNIYLDCIHCGYLRLTPDDIRRYSTKGLLAGVTCKNCNEEASLVQLISRQDYKTWYSNPIYLTFSRITIQELFDMLKRERV